MKKQTFVFVSLMVLLSMALSACGALGGAQTTDLKASGTIAAREVNVAPQIGGMVVSVSVEEGAQVKAGDELFRLDDSLFKAQRAQAEAAQPVQSPARPSRSGRSTGRIRRWQRESAI